MHFAYWMIFAAAVLPYVMAGAAKSGGRVDNARPRAWMETLEGWHRRADWAQRNHFEAFPAFAAAVFVAELSLARQGWIDLLAGIFILFRIGYSLAYVMDKPSVRSGFWFGGIACVIALFCIGA